MYGIGRRRSALIAENIVVDAPMPRAIARTAIAVNPGVFTSIRLAYLRSRNIRARVFRSHQLRRLVFSVVAAVWAAPVAPRRIAAQRRLPHWTRASHSEAATEDITN